MVSSSPTQAPDSVVIVGAGMVGLSTAWFLQEHGVDVTVLDRTGVAAGSSWGNAGWLAPALTTPLPEPAVLSYGVKAVVSPSSPVYVPLRPDVQLLRFLLRFARHCTPARWEKAMGVFGTVGRQALDAYDVLTDGGVQEPTRPAEPFLVGLGSVQAERGFVDELEHIRAAGVGIDYEVMTGTQARAQEPAFGAGVIAGVRLDGQRYIDPGRFVHALAESVSARGGKVMDGVDVTGVRDLGADGVVVATSTGDLRADAVVLATGSWLGDLAREFGVRQLVQAGRGYSFSVPAEHLPSGPVYFPDVRLACTPLGGRLRVAGTMEFRRPDAAFDPRRVSAMIAAGKSRLAGIDWDDRVDEWVGSRPCTADGLPLVGATRSPRVHVAGGHGMWGIAWGPFTGRMAAEGLATGRAPEVIAPFDPLR